MRSMTMMSTTMLMKGEMKSWSSCRAPMAAAPGARARLAVAAGQHGVPVVGSDGQYGLVS